MYAIVDIETTGGSPLYEKITEVAIFIHDGQKIVDEFVTLINPERTIPYYITGLTGITNEMVADAPKFYEVAKKIVEITKDKIFVAHNASFDYNFIKTEFRNLGYTFQREQLCTVKLSRKLIPGKRSYSLGNICNEVGISINDRHRAAGDALATVKLFEILLQIKKSRDGTALNGSDFGLLHPSLNIDKVNNLPEETGVYYFYNDKNDIIYIGKSKNIRERVRSHLGPSKVKSAMKMRSEIADISYELTGSELVALLMESAAIKENKPFYNRLGRRAFFNFGLFEYINNDGYKCMEISEINSENGTLISSFTLYEEAKAALMKLVDQYTLCQKLCGLYKSQNGCFSYEVRQCLGACIGKEIPIDYNRRVEMAINAIGHTSENLIFVDKGRNKDEKSVVRVRDGKYLGFGFIDSMSITSIEDLKECIKPQKDNREVWQIIKVYLKKSKVERIINA